VLAGALLFLKPLHKPSPLEVGALVTASTLGAVAGSSLSPPLLRRGRVPALRWTGYLFLLSSLLCASCPTPAGAPLVPLALSRLLTGAAMGASSPAVPLYVAETSPVEKRGAYATVPQFMISLGILLSYVSSLCVLSLRGPDWRLMFALGALPAGLQVALTYGERVLPETPRFLLGRGDRKGAERSLKLLRQGTADVGEEVRLRDDEA
jgi:MFS family permease